MDGGQQERLVGRGHGRREVAELVVALGRDRSGGDGIDPALRAGAVRGAILGGRQLERHVEPPFRQCGKREIVRRRRARPAASHTEIGRQDDLCQARSGHHRRHERTRRGHRDEDGREWLARRGQAADGTGRRSEPAIRSTRRDGAAHAPVVHVPFLRDGAVCHGESP